MGDKREEKPEEENQGEEEYEREEQQKGWEYDREQEEHREPEEEVFLEITQALVSYLGFRMLHFQVLY